MLKIADLHPFPDNPFRVVEDDTFMEMAESIQEFGIPCLTLPPEKEQPIGSFGKWHLRYLKEHHRISHTNLLTSGRLNAYLADIDRQARERFVMLTEQMKQAQGITEQLKAENALDWTGRMNNIRVCAMEIVNEEIIYA